MRGAAHRQALLKQKIQWMVENYHLWQHVQSCDGLYLNDRPTWLLIVGGLKRAGLVAWGTGPIDVRVGKLIQAAKTKISKSKDS